MYRNSIRIAEGWAQQPFELTAMKDAQLNCALAAMEKAGRAPDYVRSIKNAVLAVWRDAAEAEECKHPRKIRPIRNRVRRPAIWTPGEISRLVAAAGLLEGEFRTLSLSRARWWQTFVRVAWDSGLRRRDLHQLTRSDCRAQFIWTQHKTNKPVKVQLRSTTLHAIREWAWSNSKPLWPLWGSDNSFQRDWRRIVRLARIDYGPFKRIRKSAGTAAEDVSPGAGHYLLGNTRAVFERHYLDPMQIQTPQPPELSL